jgi:hypothetical protein
VCGASPSDTTGSSFSLHAEPIARTIIQEFGQHDKTIPLSDVGGTAGGLKVRSSTDARLAPVV